jgi:hypothetical protein
VDTIGQTVTEFRYSVGVAAEVINKGHGTANEDAFVRKVLKRVAEMTKEGKLDSGSQALDEALAELDRRGQKRKQSLQIAEKSLLEASVQQQLLRRDPSSVATRVEALAALEAEDSNPI